MSNSKEIDAAEVAKHNTPNDCWLILGNSSNGKQIMMNYLFDYNFDKLGGAKVCDVTKYLNDHPGGAEIMLEFAGTLNWLEQCIKYYNFVSRQKC